MSRIAETSDTRLDTTTGDEVPRAGYGGVGVAGGGTIEQNVYSAQQAMIDNTALAISNQFLSAVTAGFWNKGISAVDTLSGSKATDDTKAALITQGTNIALERDVSAAAPQPTVDVQIHGAVLDIPSDSGIYTPVAPHPTIAAPPPELALPETPGAPTEPDGPPNGPQAPPTGPVRLTLWERIENWFGFVVKAREEKRGIK